MSPEDRGLFAERGARPRSRQNEARSRQDEDAAPRDGAPAPSEAPERAPDPEPEAVDASDVLRRVRQDVRSTVDEWLSERSHTISLAVTQVVEDALAQLRVAHSAQLRDLSARYEEKLAVSERERSEALRGAMRRRRARVRAVERELRERIERLERALTEASLEVVERLREVERRETDKRLELERTLQQAIRDRDDEIARLRRGASGPDERFDVLADQLRSRRPGGN